MIVHIGRRRTATAACLWVGISAVACSSSTEGPSPVVSPAAGNSSSGSARGGSGGAGAGAPTGGTVGAGGVVAGASGSAGAGGGASCIGNQLKDATTGLCACPPYAPTFCSADMRCFASAKDPEHCGDCDTKCPMTSACSEGVCTAEPTSIAEVAGCGALRLQQQGGKLYMLGSMTGTLESVAIPAGGASTHVATGLTMGSAFALDADNAYVVTGTSIQRVGLSDGMKAVVVTEATPIFDVAVAGGKLLYVTGTSVKSVDAAASAGTGMLVVTPESMGEPQGLAVSGTAVLFASSVAFNVEVAQQAGGGPKKLGASQGGLLFGHRSVQTDGTNVYWAVDGSVRSSPFADEPSVMTVGNASSNVTAYTIDATGAYFASYSPEKMAGDLEKQAFGAEQATWVARGLPKVSSLVVDAASVYLATEQCQVLKTAR